MESAWEAKAWSEEVSAIPESTATAVSATALFKIPL
jgi:hypothetical protein